MSIQGILHYGIEINLHGNISYIGSIGSIHGSVCVALPKSEECGENDGQETDMVTDVSRPVNRHSYQCFTSSEQT